MRIKIALLTLVTSVVVVGSAQAATTRYADPTSLSTGACTIDAPCTLNWALGGATAGDTIQLYDGADYTVSSMGEIALNDLTVEPFPGDRPRVVANSSTLALLIYADRATVKGIEFDGNSAGPVVNVNPGSDDTTFERVTVRNEGSGAALNAGADALVRDSLIYSATTTDSALTAGGSLVNVTAISGGGTSSALGRGCGSFPSGNALTVRNSILIGGTDDIRIEGSSCGGPYPLPTDIDYSAYDQASATDPADLTVGVHNVTDPPLLTTPIGATDIRELAGSPTINAGAAVPGLGTADLEGQPRTMGSAPDIGADEFFEAPVVPPPPPLDHGQTDLTAPALTVLKAVKKKGKLKTFDFSSSEAGTATFTFTKKKGKKFKAAGTQTKAVLAGKNSIKPKKLKKGKYKLALTVKDAAGNTSPAKNLSFSVK